MNIKKVCSNLLEGKTLSEAMAIVENSVDEDKVHALLKFLDLDSTPENFDRVKVSTYDPNMYYIDSNQNEFLVCDDDEADEEFKEHFMNLVDDIGLDSFAPYAKEHILSEYVDDDAFLDYFQDDMRAYATDIQDEEEDPIDITVDDQEVEVTNRLFKECLDADIIDPDDLSLDDIEDGDYVGDEDLVELYCDHYDTPETLGYDSAADWYLFEFGSDSFNDFVQREDAIDWDGVAEYVKDEDGRGNELNSWDGNEYEEDFDGTTYYIYPQCDYKSI